MRVSNGSACRFTPARMRRKTDSNPAAMTKSQWHMVIVLFRRYLNAARSTPTPLVI